MDHPRFRNPNRRDVDADPRGFDGDPVGAIPAAYLTDEAPRYDVPRQPRTPAEPAVVPQGPPTKDALLELLASPNLRSRAWVFRRYDHLVGSRTVRRPGLDAAVLRLRPSYRGLAVSVDGSGRIARLDPHTGGAMHQGDVSIIMPTFYGDEHLGWSFANMHVLDVGGVGISGYAPGAHDVWQEGMRFPPIRIIKEGRIDSEWEHYIAANVRAPGAVLNDIRSMVASNNTVVSLVSWMEGCTRL